MKTKKTIFVFDPTAKKKISKKVGSRRLTTITGKHIGVIWNGKLGGDILLNRVAELLADQCGASEVERVDDRADKMGVCVDGAVIDRLVKECDAVVLGTGD